MSVGDRYDDDEYVAKLLAEDAKKSSLRYASAGLSALLPRRPTGSAPKPNTRFLQNLVRDADNHNAALKKKEELEARARLKQIRRDEYRHQEEAESGSHKKRRRSSHDDDHERRNGYEGGSMQRRRRSRSPERAGGSRSRKHSRRTEDRRMLDRDSGRSNEAEKEYYKHKTKRHGDRRHPESEAKDSNCHRPRRDGSRDRGQNRHKYPDQGSDRLGLISDRESAGERSKTYRKHMNRRKKSTSRSSSSDPLEELVGPIPAKTQSSTDVRVRGRGAQRVPKSSSNIDAHFSSNYDPERDIAVDDEDDAGERDDWDMALEALRDRTKWKQKQADRMRSAGWSEADVEKWTKSDTTGGSGQDPSHVKWARKGEDREWDRGKTGGQWPD